MQLAPQRKTMTIDQAAHELGIGRSLAYRLAQAGELPAIRLGGRILVPRARLDEMLAGGETTSDPKATTRP
jgi:excisionase family DNA binding protein